MKKSPVSCAALFISALLLAAPVFAQQTSIRPDPSGKRIAFVDGNDIRPEPGGKRLLFVDGNDIRPEPGGKRILFIDGDDVRPSPGGPRLMYIDGNHIRRAPGGRVLLYIDGKNIRPDPHGDRMFFIDGDALSRQQLIATIYLLKPELFNPANDKPIAQEAETSTDEAPPPEEKPAEAKPTTKTKRVRGGDDGPAAPAAPAIPGIGGIKNPAASAAANAAVAAAASAAVNETAKAAEQSGPKKPFEGGTYSITKFQSSDGSSREGKIAIRKRGEIFAMDLKAASGEAWQGVAVEKEGQLWAAIGPANTVGLAVYKIDGGKLAGTWMNITGDTKTFGSEALSGAETFGGPYTITAAKAPFTGAAYAGTVTLEAVTPAPKNGTQFYRMGWDFGAGYKSVGIGFRGKEHLVAVTSTGPDYVLIRFEIDGKTGALNGEFHSLGKASGSYLLTKD